MTLQKWNDPSNESSKLHLAPYESFDSFSLSCFKQKNPRGFIYPKILGLEGDQTGEIKFRIASMSLPQSGAQVSSTSDTCFGPAFEVSIKHRLGVEVRLGATTLSNFLFAPLAFWMHLVTMLSYVTTRGRYCKT